MTGKEKFWHNMSLATLIRDVCEKMNITYAELARRSNQSAQNLGKKLKNETLSYNEFLELLSILGIGYEFNLIFPGDDIPTYDKRIEERISILEDTIATEKKTIDYLHNINRDIRNNMNIICGSVEMLSDPKADDNTVKLGINRVRLAADRIDRLLDDGRNITNIAGSKLKIESIRGKRCLLVEDDDLSREVTKVLLKEKGLEVTETSDGHSAIEYFKNGESFDFVIMDILMPGMDGCEATRIIRTMDKKVPIFAFSASTFEEDVAKAKESGMTEHISKPMAIGQMMDIISKYL